jgi:hypothetical protein
MTSGLGPFIIDAIHHRPWTEPAPSEAERDNRIYRDVLRALFVLLLSCYLI